ncbi:MAG: LPS assembly lipoprotein LptE, partial [Bacteroidota bacterium]
MELNKKYLSAFVPKSLSKRKYFAAVAVIISMLLLKSCSYSFTGASVPPHLKTIFIAVFQDRSGTGEFNLGDRVSKLLTQKFIEDNTMMVSSRASANAILDGWIASFTDAPSAISGGEKVSTRRVTLNVQVVYKDIVKKTTVFEKTFTNYGDYTIGGD